MQDFVYITSSSYSGSTLLTFLLNTHPSITTIGEMKGDSMDVEKYCCSCGEPIGRCHFWQRLVAHLRERGIPFDLSNVWTQSGFRIPNAPLANRIVRHRHRSRPLELLRDLFIRSSSACRRTFPQICRTNEAFVQAVTEISGKPVFVDSSKDAVRLKYLLGIPSFRMKVVSIVRDGRGVMLSYMKHGNMAPEVAVREWVYSQTEIEQALKTVDASSKLLIRYEDLCSDPKAMMARVFRFIGVPPDQAVTDFRTVEHHILGNSMRLQNGSEIRLDTRWKQELGPAQLATFDRIGGKLNRQFGYDTELAIEAAPAQTAGGKL